MVYCFNHGIGWASSGVEYAQSYRARIFRQANIDARFVYVDMFPKENIEHLTKNIGFRDSEIIWLYQFFTDIKTSPVTFTLDELLKTIRGEYKVSRTKGKAHIELLGEKNFYTVYFANENYNLVHRVEIVCGGNLIRKDYYTYTRIYSEYYAPLDGKAHMYHRRFFNEDGSIAYEEINDGGEDDNPVYKIQDRIFYSKAEFIGYMVCRLNLTDDDVVLLDRSTGIGQAIISNAGNAKIGVMIHADHFSENITNDEYILWNNYYEYTFSMHKYIDFYVVATDWQNRILKEQFEKYIGVSPVVYTIPVGSIEKLRLPNGERNSFSVISAGRLATEKHMDWVILAVIAAREKIPEITLDIYGKGEEKERLMALIEKHNANEFIRLMGQCDLTDVYENYELYVSGSQSEGFGLTLLEAVGAGLPIVGFNTRYGNPTFVDDGENGFLIDIDDDMSDKEKIAALCESITKVFLEMNMEKMHKHSYEKAKAFLTVEVINKWKALMG